jgi:hypothetical protein
MEKTAFWCGLFQSPPNKKYSCWDKAPLSASAPDGYTFIGKKYSGCFPTSKSRHDTTLSKETIGRTAS